MTTEEQPTERRHGAGRRSEDEPELIAAQAAAQAVVDAGLHELTEAVRSLERSFKGYRLELEPRLRRRARLTVVAGVAFVIILLVQAGTLWATTMESRQVDQHLAAATFEACQRTKRLETAIVDVLSSSVASRRPSETPAQYADRRSLVELIISGVTSPPCSREIGG